MTLLSTLAIALRLGPMLLAQDPKSRPQPAPADSDVVRFVADEVTRQMRMLDVPGAVVVVVRGGRVLTDTAIGRASVDPPVLVDSSTAFRIASVSKVFTALAVLRLVETGRVALDSDVRPFIPDVTIAGPVRGALTLRQLLTHTAGFDEQLVGYLNPASVQPEPLGAYLRRAMPSRTREARDVPGYSNHGYALAGYLVEHVTHVPFDAYVRDSVLAPLGMLSTRFVREPRDTTGTHLAAEYRSSGERRVFRSSRPYPAGNIATTGPDMARFLVALGQGLRGDSTSPIPPTIAHQLVGPALVYHAALPGMGYALSGVPILGQTVWMKGGASPSHSAAIAVLPSADLSIFIAVNRQEPLVWDRVIPAVVERFFADSTERSRASDQRATGTPVAALAGTYLWTRAPLGSVERILGLATQVTVSPTASGVRLSGAGDFAGDYVARDSLLFARSDGRLVAFRRDSVGRASHLFSIIQGQPASFERIGLTLTAQAQLVTFATATILVIVAAVLAAWPRRGSTRPRWARAAIIALPVMEIAAVVSALALVNSVDALQEGPTRVFHAGLVLCTLTGIGAVVQFAGALTLASRGAGGHAGRIAYVAGAVGAAALLALLGVDNLIGRW